MIRTDVIGHLGGDAVVRDVPGQQMRAISFSVAHSEKYKDSQGIQHERTTWVSCTLWRTPDRLAIAQYLTKGTKVFVTGEPSVHSYVGNDGQSRTELKLRVANVELLGGPNNNQQPGSFVGNKQAEAVRPAETPMAASQVNGIPQQYNDDLPF